MSHVMDWSDLQTIGDVFRHNATRFADKTAFVMPDGASRSFGEIHTRTEKLAGALRELGAGAGDRVAILSKNRIEYVEVLGVSVAGLIPVPLNWRLSTRELLTVLQDCSPAALIFEPAFAAVIDELRVDLPECRLVRFGEADSIALSYEDLMAALPTLPAAAVSPEATACLLYTSGTTGQPKGAELTHRGLLANARMAIETMLELTPDDVTMAPMPFFHVGGMWYHLFPSFTAGCTTLILPEFHPATALALMQRHRVTNVHFVPTMIHALLQQPDVRNADLHALRLMFYAASCIPAELLRQATQVFSRCGFVQGYGSTEAGMVACLTPEDHRRASEPGKDQLLLSCGRALPGVEVGIVPVSADDPDTGEIVVTSPMTMARYWKNPQAMQAICPDGRLRTGDIAHCDREGYLAILDRKSDMIVTGGENVYPREVEEVLFRHPAVLDAAVFDLPDPRWVQRVVAAVVVRADAQVDAEDIIACMRRELAAYKCPKQVFVTSALPKNGAGKVLRKVLRETYAETSPGVRDG